MLHEDRVKYLSFRRVECLNSFSLLCSATTVPCISLLYSLPYVLSFTMDVSAAPVARSGLFHNGIGSKKSNTPVSIFVRDPNHTGTS